MVKKNVDLIINFKTSKTSQNKTIDSVFTPLITPNKVVRGFKLAEGISFEDFLKMSAEVDDGLLGDQLQDLLDVYKVWKQIEQIKGQKKVPTEVLEKGKDVERAFNEGISKL